MTRRAEERGRGYGGERGEGNGMDRGEGEGKWEAGRWREEEKGGRGKRKGGKQGGIEAEI